MQGDSNSWALYSEVLTFVLKAAADQDRGGNVQAKTACFRVVRDSAEAGNVFLSGGHTGGTQYFSGSWD